MPLIREPNFDDPEGFYEALIAAQRELDDEAAERFRARLLLVLANHVGDATVLAEALRAAAPGR